MMRKELRDSHNKTWLNSLNPLERCSSASFINSFCVRYCGESCMKGKNIKLSHSQLHVFSFIRGLRPAKLLIVRRCISTSENCCSLIEICWNFVRLEFENWMTAIKWVHLLYLMLVDINCMLICNSWTIICPPEQSRVFVTNVTTLTSQISTASTTLLTPCHVSEMLILFKYCFN